MAIQDDVGKGSVILWEDYEFLETGERKNSHFLVLTDCKYGSFLAIRATTQLEYYENGGSRMTRNFLIIELGREKVFTRKVAIDFTRIKILPLEKMNSIWGSGLKGLGKISNGLLDDVDRIVSESRVIERNYKTWIRESPRMS